MLLSLLLFPRCRFSHWPFIAIADELCQPAWLKWSWLTFRENVYFSLVKFHVFSFFYTLVSSSFFFFFSPHFYGFYLFSKWKWIKKCGDDKNAASTSKSFPSKKTYTILSDSIYPTILYCMRYYILNIFTRTKKSMLYIVKREKVQYAAKRVRDRKLGESKRVEALFKNLRGNERKKTKCADTGRAHAIPPYPQVQKRRVIKFKK